MGLQLKEGMPWSQVRLDEARKASEGRAQIMGNDPKDLRRMSRPACSAMTTKQDGQTGLTGHSK